MSVFLVLFHTFPPHSGLQKLFGPAFSKAVDIWLLSCVIRIMVFGCMLLTGRTDRDAVSKLTIKGLSACSLQPSLQSLYELFPVTSWVFHKKHMSDLLCKG